MRLTFFTCIPFRACVLALGGSLAMDWSYAFDQTPISTQARQSSAQVAALLHNVHYLGRPIDARASNLMFDYYIDTLDPNKMYLLQSEVDALRKTYGSRFGTDLAAGNLEAGFDIYRIFEARMQDYYTFALAYLESEPDLESEGALVLDREDAMRFGSLEQMHTYWQDALTLQLINIALSQENENAKDAVFAQNPELFGGRDLIKNDTRSPKEILANRLTRQKAQLARLKNDDVMESILNAAMQSYDPHSNYYAPIGANEMQAQSNLQLEGIGVSIRPDRKNPDYTQIATLVDGGPASVSGQVRQGDLILGISTPSGEVVDVVGYSTREIVALIRGKKGTPVTLRLKEQNAPNQSARTVTLIRDVIKQEESGIQTRTISLEGKILGVIEVPSFYLNFQARRAGATDYRSVSADFEHALRHLSTQNVAGIIIDLRGNGGGSLEEVNRMIGMLIDKGPVVQIKDNSGDTTILYDTQGGRVYDGALAVLIDLASASASEIFAGAMQDYGRALILGSTSMGKGSAQMVRDDLTLGSATITQRKFYRITGGSTQNKGVIPDIALIDIYEGAHFGERDYKNPLAWDTIKTAPFVPEGRYTQKTLQALNAKAQRIMQSNPEFRYLAQMNKIRALDDNQTPKAISLSKRRALFDAIEQETLNAENARRSARGDAPFADWATYQAHLDATAEARSLMREHLRPKLPEDEVFIETAGRLLLKAHNAH